MDTEEEGENVIVASFAKDKQHAICTGISDYRGKSYVFVRTFAPSLETGNLSATPAGISLALDKFPELLQAVKDLGEVMGPEKVVARIKKNNKQEVWVGKNIYKEHSLIYVRTYVYYEGEQEPRPTKKGVSMNVELYPELLKAVEKLAEAVAALDKADPS